MTDQRIDVLHGHSCDTKKDVITCLDENGMCSNKTLLCIDIHRNKSYSYVCYPIAVTLVRTRLWPATPQNPWYAFCFNLMDWCDALLLECHVSLKGLCEALYYKCPHLVVKVF